jgi:hypothetical protein
MSLPPSALVSRPANRFRSRSSLASVAGLAAVAAPSLLQAQIVWSGVLNTPVDAGSPTAVLDLNLNSTQDNPEAFLLFAAGAPNYLNLAGFTSAKSDPSIAFLYNDNLVAFGATIDGGSSYVGEHAADIVPADGNTYYYAFNYQDGGNPHYGWAQVSFSADRLTGTLHQWAYQGVSGAALTAGQTSAIPEPSTVAVALGLAAIGAAGWRRRRRIACPT